MFVSESHEQAVSVFLPWLNYWLSVGGNRGIARRVAKSVTPVRRSRPGNPSVDARAPRVEVSYQRLVNGSAFGNNADVTDSAKSQRLAADVANLTQPLSPEEACAPQLPAAVLTFHYANREPASDAVLVDMGPCGQVTQGDGHAWKTTPELQAHILETIANTR